MTRFELLEAVRKKALCYADKPSPWLLHHAADAFEQWEDSAGRQYYCEACAKAIALLYRHGHHAEGDAMPPRECADGNLSSDSMVIPPHTENIVTCAVCAELLDYSLVGIDGEMSHFRAHPPATPREWGEVLEILWSTDDKEVLAEIEGWLGEVEL